MGVKFPGDTLTYPPPPNPLPPGEGELYGLEGGIKRRVGLAHHILLVPKLGLGPIWVPKFNLETSDISVYAAYPII